MKTIEYTLKFNRSYLFLIKPGKLIVSIAFLLICFAGPYNCLPPLCLDMKNYNI